MLKRFYTQLSLFDSFLGFKLLGGADARAGCGTLVRTEPSALGFRRSARPMIFSKER